MQTFAVVHNIPSPYRLHLFHVLQQRLALRGVRLHVHFMARGHHDRPHWASDVVDTPFDSTFWKDVGPTLRQKQWHLNPGMVAALAVRPPDYLLVGGPWDTLTGALASIVGMRTQSIAWFEANTHTPGQIAGVAGAMKRSLLRTYTAVAIPGVEGREHLRLLFRGKTLPKTVQLPNIVDERRFRDVDAQQVCAVRQMLCGDESGRLAIWNARLTPKKGVLEFLAHMRVTDLEGWKIVIFGEGPLEPAIRELIRSRGLHGSIELKPYVDYDQMPAIYHAADLLLLPSLEDPNPLSVVEALHSGVALLVSNRIGNHPEAIREGVNGWTVAPQDEASVRRGIEAAFSASRQELAVMGRHSLELAEATWNSVRAIDSFLTELGISET